jgi:excisionase family DNA binding protein
MSKTPKPPRPAPPDPGATNGRQAGPSPSDLPGDLITATELTKLLPTRPHVSTVIRWVQQGKLRGWRLGRKWMVSKAEGLRLVEPVRVEPLPAWLWPPGR